MKLSPSDEFARHTFGVGVVIIGSLDRRDEPVFHARGEHTQFEVPNLHGWTARSRCGRVLYKASWRLDDDGNTIDGSYESLDRYTTVHIVHAIRFARPCHQCFPGES